MIPILAAALAVQFSPSANEVARGDLEFVRGVEESLMDLGSGIHDFGFKIPRSRIQNPKSPIQNPRSGAPPEPYRGLIERLGGPSWRERDAATKGLQEASATDQRWLFWGRRHPDPEVRLRCNAILRRLNPCSTCKGSGNSKNWELWPCWDCQGTTTAWPWSMWD
jgi:hypothetical protein